MATSQTLNQISYFVTTLRHHRPISNNDTHRFDPLFRYRGSLTTPPCSEGVQWVVLTRKSHVSRMDLNVRHVTVVHAQSIEDIQN